MSTSPEAAGRVPAPETQVAGDALPTTPIILMHQDTLQAAAEMALFTTDAAEVMPRTHQHNAEYFQQMALLLAETEFSEKHLYDFFDTQKQEGGLYHRLTAFEDLLAVKHGGHLAIVAEGVDVTVQKPAALDAKVKAQQLQDALEQNAEATRVALEAVEADAAKDKKQRDSEWTSAIEAARKDPDATQEELQILFYEPNKIIPYPEMNPELRALLEEWRGKDSAATEALQQSIREFQAARDHFMTLSAREIELQRQSQACAAEAPGLQQRAEALAAALEAAEVELNTLLQGYITANQRFRSFNWEAFGADDPLLALYAHAQAAEPETAPPETQEGAGANDNSAVESEPGIVTDDEEWVYEGKHFSPEE